MKKLFGWTVCLVIICSSVSIASEISLDEVVANLQANQSKIKDMYAETITTITSNMTMPGQESKGPQKMVQKGKMWTKGEGKSKIEMLSPIKQITITNEDQMAIINPDTGQKVVQDLKKMREKSGGLGSGGQMSLDKAKEFFALSVKRLDTSAETYVITGIPKKENKFLGKMEFYVDAERWVPVKILMYDAKGKPISQSQIEYDEVGGTWVPVKNISQVTTPMGKMDMEMGFSNIKVNQGIDDKEFRVE